MGSKSVPEASCARDPKNLAALLLKSAWKLVGAPGPTWENGVKFAGCTLPWVWIQVTCTAVAILLLLRWKREWAGLGIFIFGFGLSVLHLGIPSFQLKLGAPKLLPLIPNWNQWIQGLWLLALPQIPLSLGNSVYATADAARQYYRGRTNRVSERRLMLTMGANDLIAAVLGGVPVCHGCGGLTAHYRLGARTGAALMMIGAIFSLLGLLGG